MSRSQNNNPSSEAATPITETTAGWCLTHGVSFDSDECWVCGGYVDHVRVRLVQKPPKTIRLTRREGGYAYAPLNLLIDKIERFGSFDGSAAQNSGQTVWDVYAEDGEWSVVAFSLSDVREMIAHMEAER